LKKKNGNGISAFNRRTLVLPGTFDGGRGESFSLLLFLEKRGPALFHSRIPEEKEKRK